MNFINKVLIRRSFEELVSLTQDRKIYIIIDREVETLYGNVFSYPKIFIDAVEEKKNLDLVKSVIEQLVKLGADKECLLLGIGGGITIDITSFVAAIYKRGVHFGLVPTTLLSQVDAAIGGKTGINALQYKNIIGLFNIPEFAYCCPVFLKSLSSKEYLDGASEMLKIFLLSDKKKYSQAVRFFSAHQSFDFDSADDLVSLMNYAIKEKCEIIDKDFKEKGPRRILNLGHTFGHAIERVSGNKVTHGEAVSIGIVMAAAVSHKLGLTNKKTLDKIAGDLKEIGLPVETDVKITYLFDSIEKDKKKEDGFLYFVLPVKIGSAKIIHIPFEKFKELSIELWGKE